MTLKELVREIERTISPNELVGLCFDVGIEVGNLRGQIHSERVQDLVLYFYRRKSLNELVNFLRILRPNGSWDIDKSIYANFPRSDFLNESKQSKENFSSVIHIYNAANSAIHTGPGDQHISISRSKPNIKDCNLISRSSSFAINKQTFKSVESGIHLLLKGIELRFNKDHPRYEEIRSLETKMLNNMTRALISESDTDSNKQERSELCYRLNRVAVSILGKPFEELCK